MSTSPMNPQSRAAQSFAFRVSPVLHPDYRYWSPIWEMIRDADMGEIEIKRKGEVYLPKQAGHDAAQYAAYLGRSVFYNMTAKTLNSLYGTVFTRNPSVSGLGSALLQRTSRFTKDGMSLHLFAKTVVKEVLALGRYGMLVDSDPSGRGGAYVAGYTAENILDWNMEEVDGVWRYTRVVLREIYYDREDKFAPYEFTSRYRVLVLSDTDEGWLYEQHIYDDTDARGVPDLTGVPSKIIIPTVRGNPLDYIPFVIIGPFTNHPGIQKPPILDIVTLNFSHYQSYAQLEHGRFYTATPVYYTTTGNVDDEAAEYYVGPDVVWELGKDGSAGIMEFSGNGLRSLENALQQKESQISAIGGRMMPGASASSGESDNSLKMKEQNEQTLLLNISDTVDEGLTQTIRWWADWNNAQRTVIEKIEFEVNRDFLLKNIGAREFRAIHQMYKDGIIPVDVVYEYLSKADVIPDWMDLNEYKGLLQKAEQFPHMVDVLARMRDYPDAKTLYEHLHGQSQQAEVRPREDDPRTPPTPQQARFAQQQAKQNNGGGR